MAHFHLKASNHRHHCDAASGALHLRRRARQIYGSGMWEQLFLLLTLWYPLVN